MAFYCKHCGKEYSDLSCLLNDYCSRNPNGDYHQPYDGSYANPFYCKFCGKEYSDLSRLLNDYCSRNSNGDYHEPL